MTMHVTKLDDTKVPIALLMKGAGGTGKTTKLAQFPRPLIINVDKNLSSLRKLPKEIRDKVSVVNPHEGIKEPKDVWPNLIDIVDQALKSKDFDTIGFDSLSTIGNVLCNHILGTSNPVAQMTLPQWGTFQRFIVYLVEEVRNNQAGKHCVFTAHEELVKDETSGEVVHTLLMPGKLKNNLDLYFTDVWRLFTDKGKQGTVWAVRTVPDRTVKSAKSSLNLPETFVWDVLKDDVRKQLMERLKV